MTSNYLAHYEELHSAAMYDHDLTRNMLKSIMRTGGNNEKLNGSIRGSFLRYTLFGLLELFLLVHYALFYLLFLWTFSVSLVRPFNREDFNP